MASGSTKPADISADRLLVLFGCKSFSHLWFKSMKKNRLLVGELFGKLKWSTGYQSGPPDSIRGLLSLPGSMVCRALSLSAHRRSLPALSAGDTKRSAAAVWHLWLGVRNYSQRLSHED